MNLRFLEIFHKVVERKSFSKAADALYLTQPTISNHIKVLEDELQIRLLNRLGKEVEPTKAGTILYHYAKEIIRLKKEAVQALEQFSGKVRGNIEIGGSTIPGEYILPGMISEFKKKYPDVTVTLRIGDSEDVVRMVLDGQVEVGVVGAQVEDGRIESREFLSDSLILVAPPSYPYSAILQKDLKEIPMILRERGSGSRVVFEKSLEADGFRVEDLNVVAEMGSTEAVKQAVKSGLGLSVISRLAVRDELANNTLKEIAMENHSITRLSYIITDKLREKSPLCHVFLVFLAEHS